MREKNAEHICKANDIDKTAGLRDDCFQSVSSAYSFKTYTDIALSALVSRFVFLLRFLEGVVNVSTLLC